MNLLMIASERSLAGGRRGPFAATLTGLAASFERIDVLCPRVENAAENAWRPLVPSNVFLHPAPVGSWRFARWVVEEGEKLVRIHGIRIATVIASPPFQHAWGAVRLAKKTGIKLALEVHHVVGHPSPASLHERVAYLLSRLCLPWLSRRVRAVRVVNKQMAAFLRGWGIRESLLHVVPSFYLDASLCDAVRDVRPSASLVFCARLVPNKNLPLVLRTLVQLPEATLVVIGDGSERSRWERLARDLGVAPRVTFLGWLPTPDDVARAMRSAHIFVQPSLSEGGPRTAMEAMMLGMPVVSTAVGSMPDVIQHGVNGYLVDPTPEAFAETIRPLLTDAALRERVGAAATHVIEHHEREHALARYARFLIALP